MKPIMPPTPPDWAQRAGHFGTPDFVSNPHPKLGETVQIALRLPIDAPVSQIILRTIPNGEQQFTAMQPGEARGIWREWTAPLLVNEPRVSYRFGLCAEDQVWWLNALGVGQAIPFELFDFKLLADLPEIPWLERTVFYQVFPDRFYNGDPANDPTGDADPYRGFRRLTLPWGQEPPVETGVWPFYGGDLPGIRQKMDYLEELGVNALYLNPIFTGWTNHRYDVIDYEHVDPTLGGDQALVDLASSLREQGMRYVLDIVPNHCGAGHPWFQSAQKDANCPEKEYFFFDKAHKSHASWMGIGTLPKLNYSSAMLRELIYAGKDSVFRRWLREPFLADGWRVDVANMLGRHNQQQLNAEVVRGIRAAVKQTRPDAYIFGENFFDATTQLQGDGWDGVMNYAGFCDPLLHWLRPFRADAIGWKNDLVAGNRWETATMVQSWLENLAAIPWAIALTQFNVLDSHDTARVLTSLEGDKDLLRLAAIVQFTFPGVPCVYYGDELGLMNEPGFGSRNCMPWNRGKWDMELFGFYQKLIALRKSSNALIKGAFQVLDYGPDTLVYQRFLGEESLIVTANRGKDPLECVTVDLPSQQPSHEYRLRGVFTGLEAQAQHGKLRCAVLPRGGEIWMAVL